MASILFDLPDEGKAALKVIAALDQAAFGAMLRGLDSIKPSLNLSGLSNQLVKDSTLLFLAEDLPAIGRLLTILGRNLYSGALDISDVTEQLTQYAVRENILSAEDGAGLAERLRKLFTMPVVEATAKANAILTAHPYTFQKARILTEIRPLFADDAILLSPKASVIAHQLWIETRHNDSDESMFIALDDRDLLLLREAIDRAMRKSALLAEEEPRFGREVVTEQV